MIQSRVDEQKRKEALKEKLKSSDNTRLAEIRHNSMVITSTYTKQGIKERPVNVIMALNSRDGRNSTSDLSSTIHPFKMPTELENQAKEEASRYLSYEPAKVLDIKSFDAFESLNKSPEDFENERNRRQQAREIDFEKQQRNAYSGYSREEQNRIVKGFAIDPDSKAGAIVRECIPCGIRAMSLSDIEFSNPFLNTLEDLAAKLEALERMLEALKFDDTFSQDLCDLLAVLDSQCLPDLFAMISMLGILMNRYLGSLDISLNGALNSLIAPFLSPILGPFVSNLEKYVDLIVEPLTCVVNSLEDQMLKLDVIGAVNNVQAQRVAYNNKRIAFYSRKLEALSEREAQIEEEIGYGGKNEFPVYKSRLPFSGEVVISDRIKTGTRRQSFVKEAEEIAQEKKKTLGKIEAITSENKRFSKIENKKFEKVHASLDKTKKAFKESKEALRSSLYQMSVGLNQGIQYIRDNLEMSRIEIERLLTGRIQTQQDQIELARSIQQIQRWMSIVNAVIDLADGKKLLDKCNNGSSSDAMGAFAAAMKSQPDGENFNFYKGTDSEGQELMVIAPGGAKVSLSSIEFNDIGADELLGEVSLGDVEEISIFNNLNEADKLNKKGVLLDLGNIEAKDITLKLSDASDQKTDIDYRAERSYAIIKNNFCSKLAKNFGSSETIKKWTELL